MFKLWDTVRNLANVVLVLLFFVVIFSQATSIGVSQYGIKRMLPRLLTAAVLANISYYLLAFIIDTFNLFGAGVSQLVTSTILSAGNGTGGSTSNAGSIFLVVGIGVGAILLTGGLASPIITWVMSLIGTAFLILLAAVAILVIRQMLIIVIVIASPLLLVLRAIEDA